MSRILTEDEVERRIQGDPNGLVHATRLGIVNERGALIHRTERMTATPPRPAPPNGGGTVTQQRTLDTAIRDQRLRQFCG